MADSEISSKILNQVFLGNYSEDITISGTTGQIILGFSGIDFIADIRDVTYDVSHWEWSWSHAGQTGLDLIGIIPIIGSLKNCNEFSELSKLSKVDASTEIEKSVSRIDELIKSGKSESEIIDAQKKYLSEIVSSLKYEISVQISEFLNTLPQSKIDHIINGSENLNHTHNWEKLVSDKNWDDIKSYIITTMIDGTEKISGSAYMKFMYFNGYRVEVTYNKIANTYKISDAWIRI